MKKKSSILSTKNLISLCWLTSLSSLATANNQTNLDYRWQKHPEAAYYIGVVNYNGKNIKFKTTHERVFLPSDQSVTIVAYDKDGNQLFSKEVDPYQPSEPAIIESDPTPVDTDSDASNTQESDPLEEESPTQKTESVQQEEGSGQKDSSSRVIDKEIDFVVGFGKQNFQIIGALGEMDDESNVFTTAIRASGCVTEGERCEQHYQIQLWAYSFEGDYQQAPAASKEAQSFTPFYFNAHISQQFSWDAFYMRAGLSLGVRNLPVIEVNDPSTAKSSIQTATTGTLHGHLEFLYDLTNTQTLSLGYDRGLYALNHFSTYQSDDISLWWRMNFESGLFVKLGAISHSVKATGYEVNCDEDLISGCKDSETKGQRSTINLGLGYQL